MTNLLWGLTLGGKVSLPSFFVLLLLIISIILHKNGGLISVPASEHIHEPSQFTTCWPFPSTRGQFIASFIVPTMNVFIEWFEFDRKHEVTASLWSVCSTFHWEFFGNHIWEQTWKLQQGADVSDMQRWFFFGAERWRCNVAGMFHPSSTAFKSMVWLREMSEMCEFLDGGRPGGDSEVPFVTHEVPCNIFTSNLKQHRDLQLDINRLVRRSLFEAGFYLSSVIRRIKNVNILAERFFGGEELNIKDKHLPLLHLCCQK